MEVSIRDVELDDLIFPEGRDSEKETELELGGHGRRGVGVGVAVLSGTIHHHSILCGLVSFYVVQVMASQSSFPDFRSDVVLIKAFPGIEFEKTISFFVLSPEPLGLGLVASFLKAGGFGGVWG